MPELPEVEVLVRHLRPRLHDSVVQSVHVRRAKVISPTSVSKLRRVLTGARFKCLSRRGKYLVFSFHDPRRADSFTLLGHLGMTGRIYLQPLTSPIPRHTAVLLRLEDRHMVFEDIRCFGRFTLDLAPLAALGPEPLSPEFSASYLASALRNSSRPIKAVLLDQSIAAGVGNIYASESLFRARIHPKVQARELTPTQIRTLAASIRSILRSAIRRGSTLSLDWEGTGARDGLFYFGSRNERADHHERLRVYGRNGQPCFRCQSPIQRIVIQHRSTFCCPRCQAIPGRHAVRYRSTK